MALSKVTSLEVAKLAGVSQSAVSRVFTPGASASKSTTQKVRKAAEALGYRPNVLARAMQSGKSGVIGLVVAHLENQFYPVALELLSNALQAEGYRILMFTAPNSQEGIESVLQDLMDYQVDGIVTASVSLSSNLASRAQNNGIPVILFNRGQDSEEFIDVTSNNVEGGRKVARFLLAGGHERIAHIAGWQGATTGRDRQAGFLSQLDAAGIAPIAVMDGMYQREAAIACADRIVDEFRDVDAIFVGNDFMAFGVIDTLRSKGIRVGEDVSVVGYDDVPLAAWGAYELTTVRQPVRRMVAATVERLLTLIKDNGAPVTSTKIDCDLIVRRSAHIPKGWTNEGL